MRFTISKIGDGKGILYYVVDNDSGKYCLKTQYKPFAQRKCNEFNDLYKESEITKEQRNDALKRIKTILGICDGN